MQNEHADLLVIGCGFTGSLLLHHLAHSPVTKKGTPRRFVVVEPSSHPAVGPAYATLRNEHLLNVRACRMSALPDQPSHFWDWVQSQEGQAACKAIGWPHPTTDQAFLPRRLYGWYLRALWQQTTQQLEQNGHQLQLIQDTVIRVLPNGWVQTSAGLHVKAKKVVLASGLGFTAQQPLSAFPYESLDPTAPIVLIGTGLTAVDALLSLHTCGYQGTITAISRHGWWPAAHASLFPAIPAPSLMQGRLADRMKALRKCLKDTRAEANQGMSSTPSWQSIVDSLRDDTPAIWQSLSTCQQRAFLRHAAPLWNVHRHRMPEEAAAIVQSLQNKGQLVTRKGYVLEASERRVHVRVKPHAEGTQTDQPEDHVYEGQAVLDARGPRYGAIPPYVKGLQAEGYLRSPANKWGLATSDGYTCAELEGTTCYAMGSLLLGERWESLAVPELRVQARDLALSLQRG